MNKILVEVLIFVLLGFVCPLIAEQQSTLELRCCAFGPSEKRFRHLYGNAGTTYEVEASFSLCHCLTAWSNFDYFSKHGRPSCLCAKTRIEMSNISFGLKYVYPLCGCLDCYVGIGPNFSGIFIDNKACCFKRTCS